MPRNRSEKRPFTHLPELVHRYYAEEAKWLTGPESACRDAMDNAYAAARTAGHTQVFAKLRLPDRRALRAFYGCPSEANP